MFYNCMNCMNNTSNGVHYFINKKLDLKIELEFVIQKLPSLSKLTLYQIWSPQNLSELTPY